MLAYLISVFFCASYLREFPDGKSLSFTLLALVAKALKRPSKRSIVAKIRDNRYIFLEKGIARDSAEGK